QEELGAWSPPGRLAIQCRKMEREEPKRKGSSDPLKELLPTQEPVAGGSFRHWHLGGGNVRPKRIVTVRQLSPRDEFHSNSRTNFLSRCGNYHRANSSDALRFSPCSRQVLGRNSEDQSWPRNQTPAAFTSWSAAWPAPSWAWPQLGSSSLTLLCSRWLRKLSRLRTPCF